MKTKITLLTLLITLLATAQDGTLDTTFGTGGKIDYSIFLNFVDMKMDYSINKIVVLGRNSNGKPMLVRYNLDGSYDTTFDGDGIKEINFGIDETPASFCIYDYSSTTSGYLVASSRKGAIAKVNIDGTFATFGTNGIYYYDSQNYESYHEAKLTYDYVDGKIIIASHDSEFASSLVTVYKLEPTGLNVLNFNGGNPVSFYFISGQNVTPNSINTDDNGNIIISGIHIIAGGYDTYVKKYSSLGIYDSAYLSNAGGTITRSAFKPGFVFDSSDNSSYTYGSNGSDQMLVTKNSNNGGLETTFGSNGIALVDFPNSYIENVRSIVGHESGSSIKIILVGRAKIDASSSNISLARINANGTLDTSFGTSGMNYIPNVGSYLLRLSSAIDYENGKLYVMGFSATGIVSLYRFNLQEAILSTTQTASLNKITFSPNPTTSSITFSQELKNLDIFDITGKKIKTFENATTTFDVSGLEKGIYLLKGKTIEGSEFNEKLIKE